MTVEPGLDGLEQLEEALRLHKGASEELGHVRQVLRVPAFDLGQSLRVGVVVKIQTFPRRSMNRLRSRHPGSSRDGVEGARDLHVELQLLLESRQGPR